MENEREPPERLGNFGFAASWAGGIALLCMIIGQGAEQYADTLAPVVITPAGANSDAAAPSPSRFDAVERVTTGAIRGKTVVDAPCGAPSGEGGS